MGTNYYIRKSATEEELEVLEEFGLERPRVHLGKSSMGWSFSFHAPTPEELEKIGVFREVESYKDWKEVWESPYLEIFDEYGTPKTAQDLISLVGAKLGDRNHTEYCREDTDHLTREHGFKQCFLDSEGHSFQRGEFF